MGRMTGMGTQNTLHRRNSREGTTIVETIVALVLFAMFITGATKVLMSHRQLTDKSRAHYIAINITKNRIEQVRNMRRADYEQIGNMMESDTLVNAKSEITPNGKFRRTTKIHTTPVLGLLEIDVTVEIKNPITLQFSGENEHLKSYMAKLLDR